MPPSNAGIKVLIVDDEKKACTNLRNLLIDYVDPTINIIGMANNTQEAEQQIKELKPHAIFLDIEMPNENAFQFLDRIMPINFEVIFVTAYDEYAVRAFKLNAIDYILKPISIDELKTAVEKLREKLRIKDIVNTVASYTEISNQLINKTQSNKICLRDANITEVVDFKDIFYVEAHGSYSKILFLKDNKTKEMTMSNPLSDYEELLPDTLFYRAHRSYLINCAHVKEIQNESSASVILNKNITLPVSRRRYAQLIEFLRNNRYYNE